MSPTTGSSLVKSDRWAGGKCGRKRCLTCEAGVENSKCRKRNIFYESTCRECLRASEDFTYVRESSRSGYECALNHQDNYKAKHEDSHMWGHALTHHGGRMDLDLKFVIVKSFQKALTRQISEAVRTRKRGRISSSTKKGS